jgi:hypothetical protein
MGDGTTEKLQCIIRNIGGYLMTLELKQAIDIAESLSMTKKLEFLEVLAIMIQETYFLENKSIVDRQ